MKEAKKRYLIHPVGIVKETSTDIVYASKNI